MFSYKDATATAVMAVAALGTTPALAQSGYPEKPVEMICSTNPGSGAATWCDMVGNALPEFIGQRVPVSYMSGGSNHEPVVHTYNRPADGYTLLHINGSYPGYLNLPHFTRSYDDFQLVARVEQTLYGIAVLCDDPDIKSWQELVDYTNANPGSTAMGSNKVGSLHHRIHSRLVSDEKGPDLRFVPYEGTGDVVRDVLGGHLRVGMAQPGLWNPHIEAGTVCPLLLLSDARLDNEHWTDVPAVPEVGLSFDVPQQWQGFMVKKGTPDDVMDHIAQAISEMTTSDIYKDYLANQPHSVLDVRTDREALSADFYQDIEDTRIFMIENGLIGG